MFAPQVYAARRRRLTEALHSRGARNAIALFPGNREAPMNYPDNAYRFRQDSSFLYFFGIAEPELWATLDLDSGEATLYAEDISEDTMVWTGPRPGARDLADMAAIERVKPPASLADAARSARRAGRDILYLPPYRGDTLLELAGLLGVPPSSVAAGASRELIASVVSIREIKEDAELAEIERAVDISIEMHEAVIRAARPGMAEAELMALAYQRALAGGGMPSFPPIATTRGAVLHNHGYGGTLRDGGLFLLDAGAETAEGYAGDLTSTFPIGRRYDERQKAVYEIVLEAGRTAVGAMGPGKPFREAHFAAARAITAGLKGLGIMRGDTDEAVAAGAHALFFPHGVGHQMGLDVHDMEALGEDNVGYDGTSRSTLFGLKSLRMAKELKPGMVVTVEPGIYFIEGLIANWKKAGKHGAFIDYGEAERWLGAGGYRNEEDWTVSASGTRRLGRPFDKSVSAMEALRA